MPTSTLLLSLASAHAAPCGGSGVELDVLTFNTWGLPRPIAQDRRARFPGIDRVVHDDQWEVVGLQELWRGARPLVSREHLLLPDGDADSGLATVTRWQTRPHPLHVFHDASGFDAWKSKGVQVTDVVVPDAGDLLVVNTHLQAGRSRRAARARARQVDEVLRVVAGAQSPVVMVGDFNLYDDLDADRDSARRIADAGLVDAAVALHADRETYPGAGRLDRVFVRDGAHGCLVPEAVRRVDADGLSDHRPIAFRLRLRRPVTLAEASPEDLDDLPELPATR